MNNYENELFDAVSVFPDLSARDLYESLVGLDSTKVRLEKEARILLRPDDLIQWSTNFYDEAIPLVGFFKKRLPMFVFAGDVGTGKTALAESFGDSVSRNLNIQVTLYRLSLNARGIGAVGQMTALITNAFTQIEECASKISFTEGNPQAAVILLIDEADAMAQSRELTQMHHEDRAGVNALIRGVDRVGTRGLPILIVLCTNRLEAIDPAIMRRSADVFNFRRPGLKQRAQVLESSFAGTGFNENQISQLAEMTGETTDRQYGCTYSDLTQRMIPEVLIDAFPDSPLHFERVCELLTCFVPTPPFQGVSSL